jgi:hypothetical protein
MNNFEIFSLYIKALTYFEAHQCLTGNDLFINKLQHYFNLNKDKDKFLKQFITNMNKKFAFNLFCFIKGEANEEILTELIKKFNRTRVYIEDNKIASIILSLKKKYPNNEEIDKYISKRLMLEMQ